MVTEFLSQHSRWLITAATLGYGLGPFLMDMNRTHLLHPGWTGHARFHLLWASISQLAVALLALWLLWSDGPAPAWRLRLAGGIGLCMNAGFPAALLLKKLYGGTLHDPGGIPPMWGRIDGNLIAVMGIVTLLVLGLLYS